MKYFLPFVFLLFSLQSIAQDTARPGPNNKIGHSKQSQQDKEKTFFYKLFSDDLDFMGSSDNDNEKVLSINNDKVLSCLLYTSPSPRDRQKSRMPSSA